jgi:hypothetical protein
MQEEMKKLDEELAAFRESCFEQAVTVVPAGLGECLRDPQKKSAEFVRCGESLLRILELSVRSFVDKHGDTPAVRNRASAMGFQCIEDTWGVSRHTAYGYIRCHVKFGRNPAAMGVLTFGDLSSLSAADATDDQFDMVVAAKQANPNLTRAGITTMLRG